MSRSLRLLRVAISCGALLFALVASQSAAEAQRTRAARGAAKPAKPAKPKALPGASKFKPTQVGAGLKSAVRGKTIMVAPRNKTAEYAKTMKNTVEVMFQPHASSYGHLLIRVGERIYDMPGPTGARNQNFGRAMQWVNSAAYGFVYARTEAQVQKLQQKFEDFANAGHGFAMAGTGPTRFSCAGFVTAVLREHAPELKIGLSAGAIGAARRLLRSGNHDAVTLYGRAVDEAGNADFTFAKLQ